MTSYLSLEEEAMRMKTGIHDSLGRGLLMNKRYLTVAGSVPETEIIEEWGRIIAGIEGSASEKHGSESDIERCIRQAGELGVRVEMAEGSVYPGDEALREVTDAAITAHITNMLKHTKADVAYISILRQQEGYSLVLTDNGTERIKSIQETGGLKNLRNRVEAVGGSMEVEKEPEFKLTVRLPEKG